MAAAPRAVAARAIAQPAALPTKAIPKPDFVLPVVGDSIPFMTGWVELLQRRTKELGPVFQTSILGADTVLVCDGDLASKYLNKLDVRTLVRCSHAPITACSHLCAALPTRGSCTFERLPVQPV